MTAASLVAGLAFGLTVAQGTACSGGAVDPRGTGDGRRVLFIGNSLTYTNDIPGIVQAFADSAAGEGIGIGLPPAVRLRTGDLIALDPGVVATLQQAAAEALAAASTATASGVVVSLPLPAGASQ